METDKYVYYDKSSYVYEEISEEYLESAEKLTNYFSYSLENDLNENGEFIVYKLVPYKILKKEFKFKK